MQKKWDDVVKADDKKMFWNYIDWKGDFKQKNKLKAPSLHEFEVFFEHLYKSNSKEELCEIDKLKSNIEIPVIDDPIDETEIKNAFKTMKMSGFDYNLSILDILVTHFTLLSVTILNVIFFVKYPLAFAVSLLSIIPKKENLLLPKNYRGVQMMKALACLYDRIIANRLKLWLPLNIDQTTFQKGKSTLIHIFTLRVIIELAKKKNVTLYIGSLDIEKAFDHVPRSLLLKKLVSLGIGKCMLFALKQIYSFSMARIHKKNQLQEITRVDTAVDTST